MLMLIDVAMLLMQTVVENVLVDRNVHQEEIRMT
jgi:hypothetical protein